MYGCDPSNVKCGCVSVSMGVLKQEVYPSESYIKIGRCGRANMWNEDFAYL